MLGGVPEVSYSYDDSIVRKFLTATLIWGFVAAVVAVVVASMLLYPGAVSGTDWLSFGRLRPLATTLFLLAFAGNGIFAAIYYSTQRLCKTPMWSRVLSRLHFWSWQAIIASALITLPQGITQGRGYGELEWPIDVSVSFVWMLFFAANFFMTLVHRRERRMYVSLWFYLAAVVAMCLINVCTLFVFPQGPLKSDSLATGVQDALLQWWYGHNLLLFLLIVPFFGLVYYFVPKAANRPVHSYKLSIVNFWTLILVGVWVAPQHLHYTALPEWASSLGMLFGLLFGIAVLAGVANALLTLRGAADQTSADPVYRFFFVGVIFLGIAAVEEAMLSIKSINALVHYTEWMTAHLELGLLGWNGMLILGMAYWLTPKLFQTGLWSNKAVSLHFWLALGGLLLCVVPGYAAGIVQSGVWRSMDDLGNLQYDFVDSAPFLKRMWSLQLVGGLVYAAGFMVMLANYGMTWLKRSGAYEVPIHYQDGSSERIRPVSGPVPVSVLETAPVLNIAKRLDIWSRLNWHRQWEESPRRIGFLVALVVVLAFVVEVVPMFVFAASNVPPLAAVKPYTPLELLGRQIYVTEGCCNCHTQMVRPLMPETLRYGDYSQPGELVHDQPAQWGKRRIGPDLARESGKQTSFWHWRHLANPQEDEPNSAMPSYRYLLDRPIDFEKINELVQAAHGLGVPYASELTGSQEMASKQAESIAADIVSKGGPIRRGTLMTYDAEAVALIAYLQRLGADLLAPPAAKKEDAPAAPAADEVTKGAISYGIPVADRLAFHTP
tara:strand:- start:889 stop:3216 length:2328 start_codon:yes stop_codon:yes gene_type:complete